MTKQGQGMMVRLAERYPLALHEGFLAAPEDEADPAGPSTTIKFDELELMDERQVQESVDAARGMQLATLAVEPKWASSMRNTLNEAGVDRAVSQRWGQVMGPPLGQELRQLFQSMLVQLQSQGVQPVGYAVLRTPQGGGSNPRGSGGAAGCAAGGRHARPDAVANAAMRNSVLMDIQADPDKKV